MGCRQLRSRVVEGQTDYTTADYMKFTLSKVTEVPVAYEVTVGGTALESEQDYEARVAVAGESTLKRLKDEKKPATISPVFQSTFAPGETEYFMEVLAIADTVFEAQETVTFAIAAPSSANGTLCITDATGEPSVDPGDCGRCFEPGTVDGPNFGRS
jgi:hypothetical protein